jgi:DNA-binding transcriptional MerR regulator
MEKILDIAEVVRRTGLSARALRFYEARGLLKPLRTASGRRLYGPGQLEQLNRIVALKKAGLTLAQIQRLSGSRPLDLAALVAAQLVTIEARSAELAEARALLLSIQSRIERGEPIDAETFCSLIRQGDAVMEAENWKQALERHYTPEQLAHWADNPPPAGFDQEDYSRRWAELGARIEAALPLDPGRGGGAGLRRGVERAARAVPGGRDARNDERRQGLVGKRQGFRRRRGATLLEGGDAVHRRRLGGRAGELRLVRNAIASFAVQTYVEAAKGARAT